jgi:hypothetical protein
MGHKVETEFEHEGLKCVVLMTGMGHRCGYVGIPKEHPLHGVDYFDTANCLTKENMKDDTEIEKVGLGQMLAAMSGKYNEECISPEMYFNVHGGITYAGGGNYPVENENGLWFFGYDCAHCDDAPDLTEIESQSSREIQMSFPRHGTIRSLDYCMSECRSLAEQLSKVKEVEK